MTKNSTRPTFSWWILLTRMVSRTMAMMMTTTMATRIPLNSTGCTTCSVQLTKKRYTYFSPRLETISSFDEVIIENSISSESLFFWSKGIPGRWKDARCDPPRLGRRTGKRRRRPSSSRPLRSAAGRPPCDPSLWFRSRNEKRRNDVDRLITRLRAYVVFVHYSRKVLSWSLFHKETSSNITWYIITNIITTR